MERELGRWILAYRPDPNVRPVAVNVNAYAPEIHAT